MRGTRVGGYEVIEQIGAGGMSEVYKAWDGNLNRFVAIKVLSLHLSQTDEFRTRFDIEAKAIALLEHAHIVPLYAYGEEAGVLYLVLRYMPTGSLADRIKAEGPLPLDEAARLLDQLADALDYAHANGVLHRDFKTENVLLDANRDAFIADFGLAKLLTASAPRITGNFVVGTPSFMSPEQAMGQADIGPASDQYALGVVLYHMLVGALPFDAPTPLAVLQKHIREAPPAPRQLRPEIPPLAERALLRALLKDPARRYPDCNSFADAFRRTVNIPSLTDRIDGDLGSRIDAALARVEKQKRRPRDDQ